MGKIVTFRFVFYDNKSVYLSGETVSGHLVIDLLRPMKIKEVKIRLSGKAHVHWTETERVHNVNHIAGESPTRYITRTHSDTENLFTQTLLLYGPAVNGHESLPQGQSVLPFEYQLPNRLPSSFEGKHGYIRYSVKATICREWRFDCTTKKSFTVLDSLDLNQMSCALNPAGSSDSRSICCTCSRSGPVEVDFWTERTGYVPGEYISINAKISNHSNRKVKSTSVKLLQTVTYYATTKSRRETYVVNGVLGPRVPKHQTINWADGVIHIPPLPPSESRHCRIIDIDYSLVFHAALGDFAQDMRLFASIMLGTVPIHSLAMYRTPSLTGYDVTSAIPSAPDNDVISRANNDPPPNYTSQIPPPPSYAAAVGLESIMKDVDDDDDNKTGQYESENEHFTPQYTYYDWSQPSSSNRI